MERSKELYLDEYRFNLSEPLDNSYKLLNVLGGGEDGIVLHIQNKRTGFEMALKLVDTCKSILIEIEQKFASKVDFFVRCYGMFVCTTLPTTWLEHIHRKYQSKIMYGYFYEYSGVPLQTWLEQLAFPENRRVFLGMFFEIFIAIMWAHRNYGFVHGDLHAYNILVKSTKVARNHKVAEDINFTIDTNYTIKIIDFDRAELDDYDREAFENDIQYFIDEELQSDQSNFRKLFENQEDAFKMIENLERVLQDSNQPLKNLLLIPEFDIFRAKSPKESTKKKLKTVDCHVCGGVGVRALANRPSLTFCANDECVLKMGDIVHMI